MGQSKKSENEVAYIWLDRRNDGEGSIIIISSGIGPKYCHDLYTRAKKEKVVKVIDCAVSDPSNGAHYLEGQLTLMIGGDEEDVKKCWPIFDAMGKNIF